MRKNPYDINRKNGAYHAIFEYIRKKQIFTMAEIMNFAEGQGFTKYDVNIVISPRQRKDGDSFMSITGKADCRGNAAAKGHIYFIGKLKRHWNYETNRLEKQRFRLFWRKEELPKRTRTKANIIQKKIKGTVKTTKKVAEKKSEKV